MITSKKSLAMLLLLPLSLFAFSACTVELDDGAAPMVAMEHHDAGAEQGEDSSEAMDHQMDDDGEEHEGMTHEEGAEAEEHEGMDHSEMDHSEMDHGEMDHSEMDMSTTRTSVAGLFAATIAPDMEPVPVNQMHTWVLHVEDAEGLPVTDADIMIDGGMPEHGHGLPTSPQVTENLGDGDYLVEGIQFQMPGFWEVMFSIDDGDQKDMVIFYLNLQ